MCPVRAECVCSDGSSVIIQQQVALGNSFQDHKFHLTHVLLAGIYVCKSEPFEIQAYIQTHIGCRQRFQVHSVTDPESTAVCSTIMQNHLIQVQIEPDFPEVVYIDSKLFQSLIRNLANNTEAHSRKGSLITLRLWIVGNLLYAQFVNDAGDNHQCCLDLQSKHGKQARHSTCVRNALHCAHQVKTSCFANTATI